MKRGAESVTKIFAFEILPYSLIFWQTNVLVDCGVNRNRQKYLKNSCTGDEHGVVTGVVQTELTKVRNKKQYPYFSLFDTTFH